tara:strand:- start:74 stop:493 length:420 start_codon:yes stop_codon:yes gene_type:complete
MYILVKIISLLFIIVISNTVNANTIQIEFTEDDTFSKEIAYIDVGDTIEWLPKNEGHNVEFLGGPNMSSLPKSSEVDAFHSITFDASGVYLYHCKPHGNMGMLGLIIVGNDLHNLEGIKNLELSSTAEAVLQKLIKSIR